MTRQIITAPEIRAFEILDGIPKGCCLELVRDNRHAPHLRAGEVVVVDTGDRDSTPHELYAVKQSRGINIWQVLPNIFEIVDAGDEPWFILAPLSRPGHAGEDFVQRARAGRVWLSDGPINATALRDQTVGRVVGVDQSDIEDRDLPVVRAGNGRAA